VWPRHSPVISLPCIPLCFDRPSSPEPGAQPGRPDGRPRRAAQQQPAPGEEAGQGYLGPDDAAGVLRGQQAQCRGGASAGPQQRGGPTGRVGRNPFFFIKKNPSPLNPVVFLGFFLFFWFLGYLDFFKIYICPEERVFRVFHFQEYF
jgi:hypothetical protein